MFSVVVTSINSPNDALRVIAQACSNGGGEFILIGDSKSPSNFKLDGCRFFSLAAQRALDFEYARLCPERHYARKNIGYLLAMKEGSTRIIETDDDNVPVDGFLGQKSVKVSGPVVPASGAGGWVNVYRYFSEETIWPRGLPLDRVHDGIPAMNTLRTAERKCPIQQGLADDNPDVDALYRLLFPLPLKFAPGRRVILEKGAWCPFNSQNTVWFPEAYPLLYLPFHCSFRMTDIWRSFVAQRIAWVNGWSVLFYSPTVYQIRNDHDLMHDFADEVPGYLHNSQIAAVLADLALTEGLKAIPANLRLCYEKLIEIDVVKPDELPLLDAWLRDIAGLSVASSRSSS